MKRISTTPSPTALAVNQATNVSGIDMVWIFRSMERVYGYNIHASYTGFTVGKPGEKPAYQEGEYTPVQAKGAEQCALYRLRLLKFYLWAVENAPTPELKEYEEWLHVQIAQ